MPIGHRLASLPDGTHDRSTPQASVFVQVARGLSCAHQVLTLVDLAPSTIYLSATSPTEVGYLPTGDFLDLWTRWQDEHPLGRTRGVVSLLDADKRLVGDAHVLLHDPRILGSGLAYGVEHVSGLLPSTSGSCVLFLEPRWTP